MPSSNTDKRAIWKTVELSEEEVQLNRCKEISDLEFQIQFLTEELKDLKKSPLQKKKMQQIILNPGDDDYEKGEPITQHIVFNRSPWLELIKTAPP